MNKSLVKVSLALAAMLTLGTASAGIASTKHNLGSTGTGVNKFSGTEEICVFCHTPHGADASAAVPLWNRTLASPSTYTTYNSLGTSSLDGASVQVGSVSIACLSCHDGVQAMNTMINAPGSGSAGSAAFIAGAWSGANQADGKLKAGIISNLDQNLKNDHPIGIQYGGGPSTSSIPSSGDYSTFKDPDFNVAKSTTLNNMQVWWVDTGTIGRQKSDLQLYTRTETSYTGGTTSDIASTVAQPYVECATCHDPHSENVTFLRKVNTGSELCLACHIK